MITHSDFLQNFCKTFFFYLTRTHCLRSYRHPVWFRMLFLCAQYPLLLVIVRFYDYTLCNYDLAMLSATPVFVLLYQVSKSARTFLEGAAWCSSVREEMFTAAARMFSESLLSRKADGRLFHIVGCRCLRCTKVVPKFPENYLFFSVITPFLCPLHCQLSRFCRNVFNIQLKCSMLLNFPA